MPVPHMLPSSSLNGIELSDIHNEEWVKVKKFGNNPLMKKEIYI